MLMREVLHAFIRRVCLVVAIIAPSAGLASDWSVLNEPGVVGLMRHALAPGTGDPSGFRVDDCSTQRNLDTRGRSQAAAIGEKLRAEGIRIDTVLSSAWCRCRETAKLIGVAPVEIAPELNSFYQTPEAGTAQTAATRALIERLDGPALLVTHQVNITALTGVYPRSGEIIVLRLMDGSVTVLDRLMMDP